MNDNGCTIGVDGREDDCDCYGSRNHKVSVLEEVQAKLLPNVTSLTRESVPHVAL